MKAIKNVVNFGVKRQSNKAQADLIVQTQHFSEACIHSFSIVLSSSHLNPSSPHKPSIKQVMATKSRSKVIPLLVLFISILCLYFLMETAAATESDAVADLLYMTLRVLPSPFFERSKHQTK